MATFLWRLMQVMYTDRRAHIVVFSPALSQHGGLPSKPAQSATAMTHILEVSREGFMLFHFSPGM
jgi:hypothetical protein